jgi:hypothetical protein
MEGGFLSRRVVDEINWILTIDSLNLQFKLQKNNPLINIFLLMKFGLLHKIYRWIESLYII